MANFNILVTGAEGQLGTSLRALIENTLPGSATYLTRADCDITDPLTLRGIVINGRFSHIINCAAYTAVDLAETEKNLCHAVNAEGVKNLADAASEAGSRIIHISTDYIFDGNSTVPYTEGAKVAPLCQYGSSKRKGETALLALAPDSVILRTGWLYSPHGKNFVKTMLSLGATKPVIRVVCDQVGTPTFADDLARAILTVITAKHWQPGIYNFSNEGVASWYDFAHEIFSIRERLLPQASPSPHIEPILSGEFPQAATRPHYSVLDKSKIKATYGIEIPHWTDALARCMASMQL